MIHSCLVWFLWWLRYGARGPIEATPVGVNDDWPDVWIYTFELVIHLSKVQQMAFLLITVFGISRCSGHPRDPSDAFSVNWRHSELSETSFFCSFFTATLHHATTKKSGRYTTFRCGLFSFWFSGEVKHFVHLIRWNLKAVSMPLGHKLTAGLDGRNRTTIRHRNWFLF